MNKELQEEYARRQRERELLDLMEYEMLEYYGVIPNDEKSAEEITFNENEINLILNSNIQKV